MRFEGRRDRGDSLNGYCALEYRAHDEEISDLERVIAIVKHPTIGGLVVRVHPEWRRIALAEDHQTLETLFADFAARALSNGDELFRQLSHLSVGPLVTFETGRNLDDNPRLLELWHHFERI